MADADSGEQSNSELFSGGDNNDVAPEALVGGIQARCAWLYFFSAFSLSVHG